MITQLAQLISDYQDDVRAAVRIIHQSGIPLPSTNTHWINTNIPQSGLLKENIPYYKHGYGCTVSLPTGDVDFDFGKRGEIDGFDDWRLIRFSRSRKNNYGFDTEEALKKSFDAAVKNGLLIYSGYILYYINDFVNTLPKEKRLYPDVNTLPHRERDSIMLLYSECYLSAELMRVNYQKIDRKLKQYGTLNLNNRINFRIYINSWLGYLHAACEGFNKIGVRQLITKKRPPDFVELVPKSDEFVRVKRCHSKDLETLRNNIFHLRSDKDAIERFFNDDGQRLAWAVELHRALGDFLSNYRIMCEVHYLTHDRNSESQMGKSPAKQGKSKFV